MNREELKAAITGKWPSAVWEEGNEWATLLGEPEPFPHMMTLLRQDPDLQMDYLFCMTCVDWKTHLTMVYHLRSMAHRHELTVKVKLDRTNPQIETVSHLWRTAEFHEREVYEMFGVRFLNHPDLRLLILPEGWEGKFPLRKDFEDPVNMIRL
ncbi:MAG: NADH-quinone oxidoreductase subunit C [Chitinophagaceae bacterium]|nr:NADH-quinone oxidoreductase subunit C [Chitinophagaceae bacterium]